MLYSTLREGIFLIVNHFYKYFYFKISLKVTLNKIIPSQNIIVNNLNKYVYLDHEIKISRNNQSTKSPRYISQVWDVFRNLREIFKRTLHINLKRKIFDLWVWTYLTFGADIRTLPQVSTDKINITQRRGERSMLEVAKKVKNTDT